MLVIQIRRVERKEENLVLVKSEKREGRKKDILFQNPKKRGKEKMLRETESRTARASAEASQLWNVVLATIRTAQRALWRKLWWAMVRLCNGWCVD